MGVLKSIFVVCLLMTPVWVSAQTIVDGKVTEEETDFPLAGVKVSNENTQKTTYTDFDGKFNLVADEDDLLKLSLEGYETVTVSFNGDSSLKVSLKLSSTHQLDSVLVIGYGTTTYKDATGSVVGVTEKDFNDGFNTSPEQLLTGKVAGLQITPGGGAPGSGSQIRIRGGSSLNAVNEPLFVVDGVPLDNGADVPGSSNPLNSINPSDIESVSVLKDASATAIYGARASNGVIIITTKKGRKGRGLKVNANYSFSVQDRIKQTSVLSADQFRDVINERASDKVAGFLGKANTNWQDQIFKTAIAHNANVGISGMIGHKLPYRVSLGYTNEDGILKTGNFERTTGSLNLSPTFFNDQLKVELNLRGSYSENQFADAGAIGAAVRMDPTQPVYSDNDDFGGYWEWLNHGYPNPNASYNPLALLKLKNDHSYVNKSIGNLKLDYNLPFLPDLKATLNVGYDYSEGKGATTVKPFARMNYNVKDPGEGGLDSHYKQIRRNTLLDFYLNYNKEFAAINSRLDFTAGYSYQKFAVDNYNIDQNYKHTNITTENRVPYDRVLIGFFGRLNYTFNDRYLLTATVRRDGTSRFSKDDRWGWFPSVSLAWDLTEENFLKDSETLSELKPRISWGITGQENLGDNPYPYKPIYQTSINHLAYYPMGDTYISTLRPGIYDPHLKWEEQTTWNLGLDFGFFNNRLHGSVDLYKKETKDMIQTVAAPLPNLNNQITTNIGSMENKGVEITLGGDIMRANNFSWSAAANATFNQNEITKISGTGNNEFYQVGGISGGTGNNIQVNMVGQPAQSFYVYEQVYDSEGKPIQGAYVDQNNDGKINEQDLRPYHSARPKWTLGFSSNLNYKNWDLGLSMRADLGNYAYYNVGSDVGTFAAVRGTNEYLSNIQSDALNSGFDNNEYFTDYYVQNASFLKMDYLTLGYTFKSLLGKIDMRLYGTVENVFTLTQYDGLDPEIPGGIDNNFYPRPRTYSIGVNAKF